jgi:hypothetical protein
MNDELKEAIRMTLVSPQGGFDTTLVHQCAGLVRLDPEARLVQILHPQVPEKDRVALYCLGKHLLGYLLDDPLLGEVTRTELVRDLALDAKKISAYASVLIDRDKLLMRGARGAYRARLTGMPRYLDRLRSKLRLTEVAKLAAPPER